MTPFWLLLSPAGGGGLNRSHIAQGFPDKRLLSAEVMNWLCERNILCSTKRKTAFFFKLILFNFPSSFLLTPLIEQTGFNCLLSNDLDHSAFTFISPMAPFFIYLHHSLLSPIFVPSDQLSYIPVFNNRPSKAPRGPQHAILKISISTELFRGGMKSVCALGNRHESLLF